MPTPSGFLPPAETGAGTLRPRITALAASASRVVTRMIALLNASRVLAAASRRIILQEITRAEEMLPPACPLPVADKPPTRALREDFRALRCVFPGSPALTRTGRPTIGTPASPKVPRAGLAQG